MKYGNETSLLCIKGEIFDYQKKIFLSQKISNYSEENLRIEVLIRILFYNSYRTWLFKPDKKKGRTAKEKQRS